MDTANTTEIQQLRDISTEVEDVPQDPMLELEMPLQKLCCSQRIDDVQYIKRLYKCPNMSAVLHTVPDGPSLSTTDG